MAACAFAGLVACAAIEEPALLPSVTTGVNPVQKVENHAALAASREPLLSPTVVAAVLLDEVSWPEGDAAEAAVEPEVAGPLDTGALEAGALEAALLAASLEGALLCEALEATAGADDAVDADVLAVAVPLVELHPASSTAAPRAAIRLMRFMCELLVVDAGVSSKQTRARSR
jgi:hypothetical protein